jgi:hypothetical protein
MVAFLSKLHKDGIFLVVNQYPADSQARKQGLGLFPTRNIKVSSQAGIIRVGAPVMVMLYKVVGFSPVFHLL